MGLSSKVAACLCLGTVLAAPALAEPAVGRAGFAPVGAEQIHARDRGGDPLWAVVGRKPG